jgi:hypothetical protein
VGSLKWIGVFVLHIFVGTLLFICVCLAAVVLHFFVDWISKLGVPVYITYPAGFLEYLIFALDFACFVVFCIAEAYALVREIASSAGWIKKLDT